MEGLAVAQRHYDRMEPVDLDLADDDGDNGTPYHLVRTDDAIEATIQQVADTGKSEDDLGALVNRGAVMRALAYQWVVDRNQLPVGVAVAFWQQAKAITPAVVVYDRLPTILKKQVGL